MDLTIVKQKKNFIFLVNEIIKIVIKNAKYD